MYSLHGKVALVTGAASGIGRATAQMLARQGMRVVVADVQDALGAETVALITRAGGEASFVHVDLSEPGSPHAMIDAAVQRYGGLDLLHNNAAILRTHDTFDPQGEEQWRLMLEINLNAVYGGCRAAVPAMRRRGGGVIINTASMAALTPYGDSMAYAAAKGGVLALSRSMAPLLAPENIRVHALCPAGVQTAILQHSTARATAARAVRGVLAPEDIGRAVVYLAQHDEVEPLIMILRRGDSGKPEYIRVGAYAEEHISGIA
ncbi:MAG: SDR family oxidoreductase [Dehalococcoidia bacterium]|nr:SDR family oxidoreductase [Dehalococcoidia bacterium]